MRTLLVLVCSIALVFAASGAQESKKKEQQKRKAAPGGQVSQPSGQARKAAAKPAETGKPRAARKPTDVAKPKGGGQATTAGKPAEMGKAKGKAAGAPKATRGGKPGAGAVAAGKPAKPKHFNLPKQPNTAKAPPVKFQQGKRIKGSQNWQGRNYAVFRNYKSEWHDQGWWHSHHNRIVFVFGAPYYWNAGYWFPAWGYYPNAYYAWDGPIYAANNLPPDQVIANVQTALQQQGYYQGEVDGLLGPQTRAAIADYQRANGLAETAAIDQPTLQSLGMA